MPHAIVTGANGFIGKRLCTLLSAAGWSVTACGRTRQNGPWSDFIEWDITTHFPSGRLPSQPVGAVFHLASKAHALSEIGEDDAEYTRINVDGTRHTIELAQRIGAQRLVYFSSVKAMGEGNADYATSAPIDETFAYVPSSPYGASKLAAEQLVLSAYSGIQTTVIRPCLVYGPDSKGNLTKMAEAIRKNRFPPIPEFGNRRSVIHVDDLCQFALAAATNRASDGQIFLAAEPTAYSTREMYELISRALSKPPPAWHVPHLLLKGMGKMGDIIGKARGRRFVFDSDALGKLSESAHYDGSKATNLLGFQYKKALSSSLDDIIKQP